MTDPARSDAELATQTAFLADVSAIGLPELISSDDSVLANSIRHLLAEAERSEETISGWSSYID